MSSRSRSGSAAVTGTTYAGARSANRLSSPASKPCSGVFCLAKQTPDDASTRETVDQGRCRTGSRTEGGPTDSVTQAVELVAEVVAGPAGARRRQPQGEVGVHTGHPARPRNRK